MLQDVKLNYYLLAWVAVYGYLSCCNFVCSWKTNYYAVCREYSVTGGQRLCWMAGRLVAGGQVFAGHGSSRTAGVCCRRSSPEEGPLKTGVRRAVQLFVLRMMCVYVTEKCELIFGVCMGHRFTQRGDLFHYMWIFKYHSVACSWKGDFNVAHTWYSGFCHCRVSLCWRAGFCWRIGLHWKMQRAVPVQIWAVPVQICTRMMLCMYVLCV